MFAVACKSAPAPHLRRQAATIQLLTPEQVGGRPYHVVREVEGESCGGSMDAAREALRLEGAKAGATAIANVLCEEPGDSVAAAILVGGSRCSKRIVCTGDAIHWR